jgi:hypothetical protein
MPASADPAFLKLVDTARRCNVPIYSFDPRGLLTISSIEEVRDQAGQKDFLHAMAINTGGRAAVERSSVAAAAREFVEENGNIYVLGYYPDPPVTDGKFHAIEVRVKRPGLRVPRAAGLCCAEAGRRARGRETCARSGPRTRTRRLRRTHARLCRGDRRRGERPSADSCHHRGLVCA